jgi:hypothetical protein
MWFRILRSKYVKLLSRVPLVTWQCRVFKFVTTSWHQMSRVPLVTWRIVRRVLVDIVLFGLSLAELQLFTLQLLKHKPVTCLLVVSWRELNCTAVETGLWLVLHWNWAWSLCSLLFITSRPYSLVNTLLNSSSLRCSGIVLTELLHSNCLTHHCWLHRIWLLWDRCLAMAIPRCRGYVHYRSVG